MKPPQLLLSFLRWFCNPDLLDPIEGDLTELYMERLQEKGKRYADKKFLTDVILLFRSEIIRPVGGTRRLNRFGLIKSHLKTGFRSLYRRKTFSAVNILGLSTGLISCLLIFLFVSHEKSYDRFFEDADRIYMMVRHVKKGEKSDFHASTPYSFVRTMKNEFPEVEEATAFSGPYDNQRVQVEDQAGNRVNFLANNVLLADSNFLKVFSFEMLHGDRITALSKPHSVVLTQTTATRYFGDSNPVGKFISASGKPSIVTGVCQDPPANSQFDFTYLVSSTSTAWFSQANFNLRRAYCYYKLKKNVSLSALSDKIPEMADHHYGAEMERVHGVPWSEYKEAYNEGDFRLKPMTSVYLDPEIPSVMKPGGNIVLLRVLIAIAVLIFVLACVNFINLSTARSSERAREVGIRKVLGTSRRQLILQFLTESLILTCISFVLAAVAVIFLLPYFNTTFDIDLTLSFAPQLYLYAMAAIVSIALLAGLYPAFVMSSFLPVISMKRSGGSLSGNSSFKNGLIIFQFFIAFALISGTLIVRDQVNYLTDKYLGYDKEELLVIEGLFSKDPEQSRPFVESLEEIPSIKAVAGSLWLPGFNGTWSDEYKTRDVNQLYTISRVSVGDGLAELMDLHLLKGELFHKNTNDSLSVLLNEAAVTLLGLKDPIGKRITQVIHDHEEAIEVDFVIKGVIADFHYYSLHNEIKPLVLQSNEHYYGRRSYVVARTEGTEIRETIERIERKWLTMMPDRPFRFRLLDEVVDSGYRGESRLRDLLLFFSGLGIFIAAIGLLGLSSYITSLKGREISIRKVLGAGSFQIITLLSSGFLKLIGIAFAFSIPVTWLLTSTWLEEFAYRMSPAAGSFVLGGIFVMLPAWLLLLWQAGSAALKNPTDSLNSE